jgi:hypothetical protein
MRQASFPRHVEAFLDDVRFYLAGFDCALVVDPNDDEPPEGLEIAVWHVQGAPRPTKLLVHRTSWSDDGKGAVYRARVWTNLPKETGDLALKNADVLNRYAALGALIEVDGDAQVVSQAIIRDEDNRALAGVMAAATVYNAEAIFISWHTIVAGDQGGKVHSMSAWSDLDVEQIQYDWAHLGSGRRRTRGWNIAFGWQAHLELVAVEDNPAFGGGLLALLHLDKDVLRVSDCLPTMGELNLGSYLFSDPPMIGAWTSDEDKTVFVTFLPNLLKGLPNMTERLVYWSMLRASTARDIARLSLEQRAAVAKIQHQKND